MHTTSKVLRMLGNETLWTVAQHIEKLLNDANIPYGICGGLAVCLHGYQRNTVDVDLVIRLNHADLVKSILADNGFRWNSDRAEFETEEGHLVQFLMAGSKAGKDSDVKVALPEGDANVERIEGLSVIRLSRLIEMKIACGMGNLRRTHKDFADVVELIAIRKLEGSFAGLLHKSVQPTFRELLKHAYL